MKYNKADFRLVLISLTTIMSKLNILISIIIFSFSACKYSPKVRQALAIAGENSAEIEKILTHYVHQPEDSLKHRAVLFLLENMIGKGYYTITPRTKWEQLLSLSDSLIKAGIGGHAHQQKVKALYDGEDYAFDFVLDLQAIRAEDLIKNIDLAFQVWPKPWNEHLTFEEFCNYILPYRSHQEPFDVSYREKHYKENKDKVNSSTSTKSIIQWSAQNGAYHYGRYQCIRLIPVEPSFADIEKGGMAECVDYSNLAIAKARAIGLPMVTDYALLPNHRSSHYWSALIYNKDSLLYAENTFFEGVPGSYQARREKVMKVYRYDFKTSDDQEQRPIDESDQVAYLYDPNSTDVTSQYFQTVDLEVPLQVKESAYGKPSYLCVFNGLTWKPIARSKIEKNQKTMFKEVAPGSVCTVFYFDNERWQPASQAFTMNKEGTLTFYLPNKNKKRRIPLTRKTKLQNRIMNYARANVGSVIELSNSPDFRNSKKIYEIKEAWLYPTTVECDSERSYRYARIKSQIGQWVEVAEFHFYSKNKKISARAFVPYGWSEESASKAIDNDLLSYYSVNSAWLGLDFGRPIKVTKFSFAPRSDANYVVPGNRYELLYWDAGWESAGEKVADDYKIIFDEVPENALLWLRNLSKGIEEEVFLYDTAQHFFW